MQVTSIAEMLPLEHSAILLTFIKLPFVIKIFVLSIFEWPFYAGFTVAFCFLVSSADKFANSFDPDWVRQNARHNLDPNCLTL